MTNQTLITQLHVGDIVGDTGRMVLAYSKKYDRIPGDTYDTWVAICYQSGVLHPYVVWNIISTPRGLIAETGNYCLNIEQAITAYNRRVNK